eukprot:Phypoly_transcript_01482.p1 GENE.Phypoly_transcript_01482~~Phypoly_transcript_01482.p1  ORF type:complete len:1046 (+),score=217.46 Phypoly_transcript_01482:51-3140(+)
MANTTNTTNVEESIPEAGYASGSDLDTETGTTKPRVRLSKFLFRSKGGNLSPLECIPRTPLQGEGLVTKEDGSSIPVKFTATQWNAECGAQPVVWVKSKSYFYRLLDCDPQYEKYFAPTKCKVALASALLDIVDTNKPNKLSYEHILQQLQQRNTEFTEEAVLLNSPFLLNQALVFDTSVTQSDFFVKLRVNAPKTPPPLAMDKKFWPIFYTNGQPPKETKKRDSPSTEVKDKQETKKQKAEAEKEKERKRQAEIEEREKKKEEEREKKKEEERERKRKQREEQKRYPIDDVELIEEEKQKGIEQPTFPEPTSLQLDIIPHNFFGDVLMVWEFANSFRKVIGLARDSFGAEDLAVGLAPQPKKDNHTLVVQIHIALLSSLLAGGKEAEEEEEEGGPTVVRVPKEIVAKREKLKLAHGELRKLPITHLTWFEILRRFVELSNDETRAREEEGGEDEENKPTVAGENTTQEKEKGNGTQENEAVTIAVRELASREYETLSLDHKLSLLEYLCYEVENTIAFRAHIREQVEIVEGLYKEKYAEETKLKKAKKVLEGELLEKRKIQALMSLEEDEKQQEKEDASVAKSIESSDKDNKSNPNKPSTNGSNSNSDVTQDDLKPRRDLLQIQKEEERLRRLASVEQRKLEVEQKRLETQKKTQERNLAAIHDRYAESLMKAARQYRTPCMGQDRHKNRYWLFAGGKGRGFYAGKVLVENPNKNEWGYYSRDQVEKLVDILNPKGKLEVELKQALIESASLIRAVPHTATPVASALSDTTSSPLPEKKDSYVPPALQRLKDSILDFHDRIPREHIRKTKEYTAAIREWKEEDNEDLSDNESAQTTATPRISVQSLVSLLLTLERNIATEALVDDWISDKREPWEEAVKKCLTSAQLGVCLVQLEGCVKTIANAQGCIVCGDSGNENRLLLCDTCESEYHTYCLNPPLRSIPAGDWFCPACQEKKPNENDDVCFECHTRGELLCCDYCSRAYHLKCCTPPLRSIPRGKWTCVQCAKNLAPPPMATRRMSTRSSKHEDD